MDVSIAVSLIRGQMGNVVERAVNGAVETVLAEMLKVVGVKFEELKAQVVQMKKDMMVLQREKSQKEKENDNIRAKLRYTELKLKYYRQGVEEELQQRASASTLVWIQPPTLPQTQRSGDSGSPTETLSPFSVQTRSAEEALMTTSNTPECTSSQSTNKRAVRVSCPSSVAQSGSSDLLLPASLTVSSAPEPLDSSTRFFYSSSDSTQCKEVDLEDVCEEASAPPPAHALTLDGGQQSRAPPLSPHGSAYADSSTLACFAPEVKQEAQVEEKEVIYIKEEPEEEQEVMATLMLDRHVQQVHQPESEAQWSAAECPSAPTSQMHPAAFSSAGPSTLMLPPSVPPRPAVRPWSKDLSLYEEYKMQRSELRRRNILRRRELEKSLPQPLLADLVRERREKTRLRVARWRAKRKLQACLNQAQDHGGAAGLPQTAFPISQHQQLRAPCASSSQQRRSSAASQPSSFLSNTPAANSMSAILPLRSSSSSSSLLRGLNRASNEHTVTASSSYPPSSTSQQSIALMDTDVSP